jgi:hypothetical protein
MRRHKLAAARLPFGQSALLILHRFIDSFCDAGPLVSKWVAAAEMAFELLVYRMECMDPDA